MGHELFGSHPGAVCKNHRELFAEHGISIIRYPFENVGSAKPLPNPEIARQLTDLCRISQKHWSAALKHNILTKGPIFHPGRVLVSKDVCCYLGKISILYYLNCYVRGDWCSLGDGQYGECPSIWARHQFGGDLELLIQTNPSETRTVICFAHERLAFRRRAQLSKPTPQNDNP